jgi:glutamine synthetase
VPAALRHLALGDQAGIGAITEEARPLVDDLVAAIKELDDANQYPEGIEGMDLAIHARDKQLAAMERVREASDKLEEVVADDLWPLPKYAEMLFIR